MMGKIRVLVTGEETLVREALASLLKTYEDIDVIGEATDGKKCVEKTRSLEPDVVLMDMTMKAMNGFEATRRLSREISKTRIVMLADRFTKDTVARTFLVGAHGCIPSTATSADLEQAIRAVHSGEIYLHPCLTKTFVEAFLLLRKIETLTDPYEQLTDREKQVLRLVAEGGTTREIAADLDIALKTASDHRANVMKKLGIHSQIEVVRYALQKHLIKMEGAS